MQRRRRVWLNSLCSGHLSAPPGSLLQNQLVQCQARDRAQQTHILLRNVLHPTHLIGVQTAIFFASAIIDLFAVRDPPN